MQIDSRTLNQLITKHVKAGLFCTLWLTGASQSLI
jgi:hypothetical protein